MNFVILGSTIGLLTIILSSTACTVENNSPGGGSSGTSSGGTSSGGTSSGGTSSGGTSGGTSSGGTSGGTSSGGTDLPGAPSTSASEVDIDGTCPAFAACGGTLAGVYDYTGGCITDVFASARQQCPTLDSSQAKVTVTGTLYFQGNALTRRVTSNISGSIKLPMSCTAGQCAAAEAALKQGGFTATCTGTADCTCTIAKETKTENATTFTTSGNNVTTGDGETYQICVNATGFDYSGKSAGAEVGVWNLKKR